MTRSDRRISMRLIAVLARTCEIEASKNNPPWGLLWVDGATASTPSTSTAPPRLTGVFADVRAARGELVGLRMDPAGCHLFPAEP